MDDRAAVADIHDFTISRRSRAAAGTKPSKVSRRKPVTVRL